MKHPSTERQEPTDTPIRERLSALAPGASSEALAGTLLRSAAASRRFGAKEIAEVEARLRSKASHRPRFFALQVAIALALILFGSALSAGVSHVLRMGTSPKAKPEPPPPASTGRASPRPPRRPAPTASTAPTPAEPEDAPPAAPASVAPAPSVSRPHPLRAVAMRDDEPAEKPAAAPPSALEPAPPPPLLPGTSALARESRLLARAIAELRHDGNAEQALATLEEHRREFGSASALSPEANAARIEALLRLGRHTQALALLDAMALGTAGPQREMLVARAELRLDKGRRSAALHDFDRLLAGRDQADAVAERARFGRANCRAQMGDVQGARGDLEAYLAAFPAGRFAAEVRATLGSDNH